MPLGISLKNLKTCFVLLQAFSMFFRPAFSDFVHQFPECRTMVMMDSVAQFVLYHIINKFGRKSHEIKGKIDIVTLRTASPARF